MTSSETGTFARKNRGRYAPTNSRPTSPELTDWLAAQLRGLSTKEVALLSETSERAAENAKLGKCAFNMASLVAMCRNSPEFAAAYAEYVGLILPGESEFVGALTNAFNAFQRRKV